MENNFSINDHEEQMELPPGFRFHPRDDELIIHYLYPKVSDASFISQAIGDVDLNKFEPWDLPLRAKFGEKEWYFFCVRDRKYPTGLRTNRATEMGYWKATGKDKEIYKAKTLVGMKKTLVFYKGRAPKGEKTNWVMHEFRLDGKLAIENLPKSTKGEWVISKVFEKTSGEKKNHISGVSDTNYDGFEHEVKFDSSNLPPLMDTLNSKNEDLIECFNEPSHFIPSNNDNDLWFPTTRIVQNNEFLQYQEDPSILRFLISQNNHSNMQQNPKIELGNDQDYPVVLAGAMDLDGLWNC